MEELEIDNGVMIPPSRTYYILTEPIDILRAVKSFDMAKVLWEIKHNLRKQCEWECKGDEKMEDGVELVFKKIHELFWDENINIDELNE